MMKGKFFGLLLLVFLSLLPATLYGTHLRAGEITVERVSCSSLTFRITITVYTNTASPIKFGDGLLNFGDGSQPHTTPERPNIIRTDLGPDIGTVSYTITHTYGGPGRYIISYLEPNRNAGILNMFNSVETRFYLETVINIDPLLGCSNSPKLLVPPIDKGCTGSAWFHNPGAYDPDGDSLSYELTIPKREKNIEVNGYRVPNSKEFYDRVAIPYGTANENQDGSPTFTINPTTGTLIWDSPGAAGEYNIAFVIKEWRKIAGSWALLGSVTRDMQIIIENCKNKRPELLVPPDICVEAGTLIKQDIFGFDPDSDSVKIEVFSQILNLTSSPAKYQPFPTKYQASAPTKQAILKFEWQTDCSHIKEQPYQVVFKISDKPKNRPVLVQFKTWNIRVVGPAPKWNTIAPETGRKARLTWQPYVCQNASLIQVWRRVDQFPFTPPQCVTGMPDFLGYEKIADAPATSTSFVDNNNKLGLAVGAQYCYRLVAVFPLPQGGESYVSQEICLPPIEATAPVITNVTVDRTNTTNGQITVKWRSPFDLNKKDFPPPYKYEVRRAEGFSGELKLVKPHTGKLTDSTYVDTNLNTEEVVYNYRVILFDVNNVAIDTSDVASSVRIEAKPEFKQIQLTWAAVVPWSINTQDYPRHLIYRGKKGDTESQLVLIDSVNVNEKLFNYLDEGKYKNTPLSVTETYCYRVLTRGAYGNPKIKEPLLNYSQIICTQPNDDQKPCKPELTIKATTCEEYFQTASCNPLLFSNTLTWKRPADLACRADIKSYKIYGASKSGAADDEFTALPVVVTDTFYVDRNLPSFARCYKISAVDRAGNESDLSEAFCFDNCPYYELPNVFTPNGDGCNDKFSAYNDQIQIDESGSGPCGKVDVLDLQRRCARFVVSVNFKVFNRWGREVYSYWSGGEQCTNKERCNFIDWDGRDDSGKELATGVYYYIAEVTFDVVDPTQQTKIIKGWVQLMR